MAYQLCPVLMDGLLNRLDLRVMPEIVGVKKRDVSPGGGVGARVSGPPRANVSRKPLQPNGNGTPATPDGKLHVSDYRGIGTIVDKDDFMRGACLTQNRKNRAECRGSIVIYGNNHTYASIIRHTYTKLSKPLSSKHRPVCTRRGIEPSLPHLCSPRGSFASRAAIIVYVDPKGSLLGRPSARRPGPPGWYRRYCRRPRLGRPGLPSSRGWAESRSCR